MSNTAPEGEDITSAVPQDLYIDPDTGKVWRIETICHEPTVIAREVEGRLYDPLFHQNGIRDPQHASIITSTRAGAINSFMWKGWKRIWRKPDTVKT